MIKSLKIVIDFDFSSFTQIKPFDDIRGIDSKEAFIRVCTENGYEVSKLPEDWKMLSCYVSAGLITTHLLFTISN